MSATSDPVAASYHRWLSLTAVAYALLHHVGLLPGGLGGGPDGTRLLDWLDLLLPWLVLAPAALTLRAAGASTAVWVGFGAAAICYTSGHGIHLAANSIGNAAPSPTAHLWDELVGHALWYAGVAFLVFVLAATMEGRPRPHPAAYPLALAVGLTFASNAVGAELEAGAAAFAGAFCGLGWRQRRGLGIVLLVGFAPALVVLLVAVFVSGA